MGNENNRDINNANRSTAPTPETIASINEMIKAAVDSALASQAQNRGLTMADLAPILKEIALTPEKLEALKKPYEDPAVARRKLREQMNFKDEEKDTEKRKQDAKHNCTHMHPGASGLLAISFVNNFYDRQTRATCMKCGEWFAPREWRVGAPDEKNPKGRPYIAPAHPQWDLVRKAAQQMDILIQEL